MPNIYISASLAASVEEKAQYVKNRGFEDEAYKKWILNYLGTYKTGKKKDFLILLKEKLPDTMNDKQKEYKVQNLLQSLRREGFIETDSENHRNANWVLSKSKPVI